MKSKTILSEEQRKRLQVLIDENLIKTVYKDCYNSLLAAEEEIGDKDKENERLKKALDNISKEYRRKFDSKNEEIRSLIEENAVLNTRI